MERKQIQNLSEKEYTINDMDRIKKEYEISYGQYENCELKKALNNQNPFYIKNHFIIGYKNNEFISDKDAKIKISRMVKAVIIEEEKEIIPEKQGDYFVIIGKNDWEKDVSEFMSIFGDLRVGEIFLPPHSAVINFLNPTEKEIKSKIVSMLLGININIYSKDNYIDNAIHEIGHLFWRDCLSFDEKQKFKEHFLHLKQSAIYEYDWEKSNEEEVFATIYKWYVKSLLLNPSFYNILKYEEPQGLKLLQDVFDRIAKDKLINDIWELNKDDVFEYLNPRFDKTIGKKIIKKGLFEKIKDIELPDNLLNDINRFESGITFINLEKAVVPVRDNKIDWDDMAKAKYIRKLPDGKGGFKYIYKDEKKKRKGKAVYFNKKEGIAARHGKIESINSKTLKQCKAFDSSIESKEYESCGVFDKNGALVFEKDGAKSSIEFSPADIKKMAGMEILSHNHPKGSGFSLEDVILALKIGIKEIRAVSVPASYSLKINYKSLVQTKEEMTDRLNVVVDQYYISDGETKKEFWKKINDNSLSIEEAEASHHHELWKKVFSSKSVKDVFNIQYQRKGE